MKEPLTEAVNGTRTIPLPETTSSAKPRRGRRSTSPRVATVRIALVRERGPLYAEPIRSAADVYRLLRPAACSWDRERFISIVLDGKNRVAAVDEVAVGSVTAALVHPREVLKAAILANGVSLIVVTTAQAATAPPRTRTSRSPAASRPLPN